MQRQAPEELGKKIVLRQRLVLTGGNAQRLARLLYDLIQRYEQTYGPIRRANANRPADSPPPSM